MKLVFSYASKDVHPVADTVYYWQPMAIGGAEASRYNRYVCGVLGAVAQTADDCDRLLAFLDAVEMGQERVVETGGNDVTLTITPSRVQVDIEANENWVGTPDGVFTLREWRLVLEGWKRFLEMPQKLESIVEVLL